MIDFAVVAGSVSVVVTVALNFHAPSLASLLLVWLKSLFSPKRSASERSGLRLDFDWKKKRFRIWWTREPARSLESNASISHKLLSTLPLAVGCQHPPVSPVPSKSDLPILLLPPGHTWTIMRTPEIVTPLPGNSRVQRRTRRNESQSSPASVTSSKRAA
jgi:hypothetical protein